jgi:hypothetical protein
LEIGKIILNPVNEDVESSCNLIVLGISDGQITCAGSNVFKDLVGRFIDSGISSDSVSKEFAEIIKSGIEITFKMVRMERGWHDEGEKSCDKSGQRPDARN